VPTDSRVVDGILLLLLFEAVVLGGLYAWRRIGVAPARFLPNFIAGAGLLLALRGALTDGSRVSIALWLLLGFAGHLVDLAGRWNRRRPLFK